MNYIRNNRKYRGTTCLNCDHPLDLSDKYCPECGQENSTKKLSFDDFFNEFFSGIFAYDSRLRRTLKTLIFYPGKITKDYVQGKRIRYANPFKFYLSASIIFFLIWSLLNNLEGLSNNDTQVKALDAKEREILRQDLPKLVREGNPESIIDTLQKTRQDTVTSSYHDDYISQEKIDSLGKISSVHLQTTLYYNFYDETKIVEPIIALDSLNHVNSSYNQWLYKKITDFEVFKKDPQIFWSYFMGKLPFIIFFYLPFLALFIWLLYWRRAYNYMEHLIFTFHVQTTFFVVMCFAIILDFLLDTDMISGIVMILFLFYLYKAMRRFYGQGRFKTLVKFILLNGIFLTLAIVAAIFSLLASFAIY